MHPPTLHCLIFRIIQAWQRVKYLARGCLTNTVMNYLFTKISVCRKAMATQGLLNMFVISANIYSTTPHSKVGGRKSKFSTNSLCLSDCRICQNRTDPATKLAGYSASQKFFAVRPAEYCRNQFQPATRLSCFLASRIFLATRLARYSATQNRPAARLA